MKTLHLSAALLLGLSVAACDQSEGRSEPGSVGAGGKADDAQGADLDPRIQQEHLAAVGACELAARRDREHTSALRYIEQTEIEQDRLRCIATANDSVRSALAATLQITAPELANDVDEAFNVWRSEYSKLCSALIEGHEHALEKSVSAVDMGCIATAELKLAEAVEAFADLGGSHAPMPNLAGSYDACYGLFEAALMEPLATEGPDAELQHEVDANELLADCIEDELVDAIPLLADQVVDAYPGRDQAQVEEAVARTFEGNAENIGQVCVVLGYSAADGGPAAVQACRASAALWRHQVMGLVVPEIGPRDPATDGE